MQLTPTWKPNPIHIRLQLLCGAVECAIIMPLSVCLCVLVCVCVCGLRKRQIANVLCLVIDSVEATS